MAANPVRAAARVTGDIPGGCSHRMPVHPRATYRTHGQYACLEFACRRFANSLSKCRTGIADFLVFPWLAFAGPWMTLRAPCRGRRPHESNYGQGSFPYCQAPTIKIRNDDMRVGVYVRPSQDGVCHVLQWQGVRESGDRRSSPARRGLQVFSVAYIRTSLRGPRISFLVTASVCSATEFAGSQERAQPVLWRA